MNSPCGKKKFACLFTCACDFLIDLHHFGWCSSDSFGSVYFSFVSEADLLFVCGMHLKAKLILVSSVKECSSE